MTDRLKNKVCIVTGAASGQGRVAAELFAREGALLVLADIDTEGLRQIDAVVTKVGRAPIVYEGDLSIEAANDEMVASAVQRHGRVDCLYNAAGLVRFGRAHETSLDDWLYTLKHELTMTFLACKYAIRAMLNSDGGSIVNISSNSGLFGVPRHAAHAATKSGIVGLTKQLAVDYGPNSIRCNAIAPGFLVYEPGQRRIAPQSTVRDPEGIPLGRHARSEDTANCALFLLSDDASYITGQVISVDGGASAK